MNYHNNNYLINIDNIILIITKSRNYFYTKYEFKPEIKYFLTT